MEPEAILIDLDGVLYVGGIPVPGAVDYHLVSDGQRLLFQVRIQLDTGGPERPCPVCWDPWDLKFPSPIFLLPPWRQSRISPEKG